MTWIIRRLSHTDTPLMREVNQLFAEAFEDAETYLAAAPEPHYYTRLLKKPDLIVLAAFANDRIIGALVAYTLEKLEQARSEIYIYDLAVAAEFRRRGVASALLRETQAIAAATGAWVVYVQADDADPPAIALYTKLGQREEVLHFDLPPLSKD